MKRFSMMTRTKSSKMTIITDVDVGSDDPNIESLSTSPTTNARNEASRMRGHVLYRLPLSPSTLGSISTYDMWELASSSVSNKATKNSTSVMTCRIVVCRAIGFGGMCMCVCVEVIGGVKTGVTMTAPAWRASRRCVFQNRPFRTEAWRHADNSPPMRPFGGTAARNIAR